MPKMSIRFRPLIPAALLLWGAISICIATTASAQNTSSSLQEIPPRFLQSGKAAEYKFPQWIAISYVGLSDAISKEYVIAFSSQTPTVVRMGRPFLTIVSVEPSELQPILDYLHNPAHTTKQFSSDWGVYQVSFYSQTTLTEFVDMDIGQVRDLFLFLTKRVKSNKKHSVPVKTVFDDKNASLSGLPPTK